MAEQMTETAESCACGRGPGHVRIKAAGCDSTSADHARCRRCGSVVHLLLTAHHDLICPPGQATDQEARDE